VHGYLAVLAVGTLIVSVMIASSLLRVPFGVPRLAGARHAASVHRVGQKTPDPSKCQITFYEMPGSLESEYTGPLKGEPRAIAHSHSSVAGYRACIVYAYASNDQPSSGADC